MPLQQNAPCSNQSPLALRANAVDVASRCSPSTLQHVAARPRAVASQQQRQCRAARGAAARGAGASRQLAMQRVTR